MDEPACSFSSSKSISHRRYGSRSARADSFDNNIGRAARAALCSCAVEKLNRRIERKRCSPRRLDKHKGMREHGEAESAVQHCRGALMAIIVCGRCGCISRSVVECH